MSFTGWLRSLRPALAPHRAGRKNRRRSPRTATHRPRPEVLEDRCLLSLNPAVNYAVAGGPLDAVVGDFDGDGKANLVTVNATDVSVLPGNGDGTVRAAQPTAVGSALCSLAAGDVNGDGRLYLAITSSVTVWNGTAYVTTGSVLVLFNKTATAGGPVSFQAAQLQHRHESDPGAVAVGDLNGDGKLDVAPAQAAGAPCRRRRWRGSRPGGEAAARAAAGPRSRPAAGVCRRLG